MYSSQLQLKFSNVSEAKIAAQSLCELLKSRISVFDFHGLQVTVGKDGDLSISVRFQDVKAMNDFEKDIPKVIEEEMPGFFTAAGFSGTGLMHAPAAGLIIKDLVKFGKSEKINLAAFSSKRFETLKNVSEKTGF